MKTRPGMFRNWQECLIILGGWIIAAGFAGGFYWLLWRWLERL